ncbi:hypothetical protein [Rickettsiella endosymbiont of Miltochrista miniata]|uniref:hypothetical protein n=1 Tax=Rickettsiella endosymbiont of Miltochrista miniata TaxID=3066239 RepID=UPI00313C3E9A
MYPAMDYQWISLSDQPYLLECDIDLVKEALTILLHPIAGNSDTPPDSIEIAHALNNYLKECNNAFLASERIRVFLLLCLFASLTMSFIALAIFPVTAVSITLIFIVSLLLFSVNIFTLFNQMSGYQQEIDWNKLKTHCSEFTKKLYSEKFKTQSLNSPLQKVSSPTSDPCLFSAKKIPQNDVLSANIDNNRLNHIERRLSPINEDFYDASIEPNEDNHLISFTK